MGVCSSFSSVQTDELHKNMSTSVRVKNDMEINEDLFIKILLKCHNDLRKKYKLNELVINKDINELAEEYAEEYMNNKKKYKYQPNIYKFMYLGENLILSQLKEASEIFNLILKEEKDYYKNSEKFSKKSGHYSQVISKDTTDIGIGICADKITKRICVVILYYPPGNIL